ncbi:mitochondrial ribosomal death-associated protein 3-domain-containing protein [Mycena belliarum]|uniref:Small ribosomal subunit protein mS29 n=1 Tax=Mycena belliarum TaxID=1033014 RepID=A0AAD6XNM9_9AGAR|nr:mitochondrial ribosomal death-associated protein 3-domain-containing protein [Mycena belliae]
MFLLGRGGRVDALVRLGARFKSKSGPKMKPKDRTVVKQDVPRDAMGRPIRAPREKSLGDATSPLRVFGLPKHMLLEFRILGMPCSVTTSATLSIIRALEESKSKSARLVLNGRPGCGKSFLLLQAAEYAAASGEWIVLYIPRTRRFVDGSSPYQYSLATQTYLQPRAASETLDRLGTANQHLLEVMYTSRNFELDGTTYPEGTPLIDIINALKEKEEEIHAVAALEHILRELGEQTLFPVLIAIDDFQTLAGPTLYRDPRFRMIRPHHLSMPRLLLEFASGRKQLSRGMVLGALSRSDTQFPISAQLADALRLPADFAPTPRSVRWRRSAQLAMYLEAEERALRAVRVPDSLSVREAAALFEMWLDTGNPLVADTSATTDSGADELFLAKYAESSGNARAFVWGGLIGTLQSST